ncbi:rCG44361 [Rattus norvegicus]|uniref:RCG44361 n=1 Tax=Rattus norvegicus TaxID=10116 RepID=A6I514_RAT|nr:rCG44361 [Rattus norvegicus]
MMCLALQRLEGSGWGRYPGRAHAFRGEGEGGKNCGRE